MSEITGTRVAIWAESPNKLMGVQMALGQLGCEIRTADSGAQLIQWVRSGSVDLVVTWLDFDDQSAFELLARLKGIPAAPPVLVVGCALGWELYLEVMRQGAFDCLGIPLDLDELERIVGKAVGAVSLWQTA
jgi:two-component system, NtrC family, nitrogen regulation response regulator GlnG